MLRISLAGLLFFCFICFGLAQNNKPEWNCADFRVDSLLAELPQDLTLESSSYKIDSLIQFAEINLDSICLSKIYFVIGLKFDFIELHYKALNFYQKAQIYSAYTLDSLSRTFISLSIARNLYLAGRLDEAQKKLYSILQSTHGSDSLSITLHGNAYYYLAQIFQQSKTFQKASEYYDISLDLYTRTNYFQGIIESYIAKGFIYISLNQIDSAFYLFEKSLQLSRKYNFELEESLSLSNRAICFYTMNKKEECLADLNGALKIAQKYRKTRLESVLLNNIAYFYTIEGKPQLSIPLLIESEKKALLSGNKRQLATTYESFYQAYQSLNQYREAFYYSKKYISIKDSLVSEQLENSMAVLAAGYESDKKDKEIEILKISKQLNEQNIKKQRLVILGISILLLLGALFIWLLYLKHQRDLAVNNELNQKNAEIDQQKEEILQQKEIVEANNKQLQELTMAINQSENVIMIFSSDFRLLYANDAFETVYGYKLEDFRGNKKLFRILEHFENPDINSLLKQPQNQPKSILINNLRRDKFKNPIWIQSNITPVFSPSHDLEKIIIVESDISKIKKTEQEILNKNIYISESIQYAQNIQNTILPEKNLIKQFFNSFIILKPKDIVSGDFYWFYSLSRPQDNWSCLVAIIDCTGHGVPGAFMSLIAHSMLQETIRVRQLHDPQAILSALKEMINRMLPAKNHYDGFEIALCRIDALGGGNYQALFSGAKLPLFVKQTENQHFERIKGTNLGIYPDNSKNHTFELHKLHLKTGDQIVLATDGIIDMPDENRKRLGTLQFMDIINQAARLNRDTAHEYTLNFIDKWQENSPQRDDIAIWSIELL